MCLIFAVGINFKILLIMLILVCKIGMIVIFFFESVFCVDLFIGVLMIIFFKGIFCDIL